MENTTFKLGKLAPKNSKSLSFGDFLTKIPDCPLVDFAPDYSYPMDENDRIGDCVVAGFDHLRQAVTGLLTGTQKNFTTAEIEAFYKTQNPNFPAEDNGMDIQTFLECLQAGKHIIGFARIDHANEQLMKSATYLGLGIMTGVQLQQAQEAQFPGQWDYVAGSPILGGHCVPSVGYNNSPDILDVVSWGRLLGATQSFFGHQCDEAWFVLMQEHVDHPSFRNHFDVAGFATAVSEITGGKISMPVPATKVQNMVMPSTTSLIAQFEGLSLVPYRDSGGTYTIGYGSTTDLQGHPVSASTPPITIAQATQLLTLEIQKYAQTVNDSITVTLDQNQFDACTSLCFNIGQAGFAGSTVARDCNLGNLAGASQAFLLWDKVKGVTNQALLARRQKEMQVFLK